MYKKFFGLHQKPFSVTPDPAFFYPSASHRDGLANLRYGIRERMGFVVLNGEVGIGKTFLVRSLLRELGEDVKRALILNPILEPDELFNAILRDLEVSFDEDEGFGKKLDRFNEFLLEEYNKNCLVVVIIDESQNLSADALERLRLLSNLETATSKLLQIILVGQPELEDLLALPAIRQLNQRVTIRHSLSPLTATETPEYIRHRLNIAGGNSPQVEFSPQACRMIYKSSRGIPRLIGVLCDYCLLIAFTEEVRVITPKIAKEAIAKHRRKEIPSKPSLISMGGDWKAWAPIAVGSACLAVSLGLTAWNIADRLGSGREEVREPAVVSMQLPTEPQSSLPDYQPLGIAGGEFSAPPREETVVFQTAEAPAPMTDSSAGLDEVWGEEDVSVEPSTETVEVAVVEEPAPAPAPAEYPIIEIPSAKKKAPAKQPEPEVKAEPVPEVATAPKVEEPLAPPPEPPSTLAGAADAEIAEEEDDLLDDPDPNRRYGIQVASFQTIERARQMAEKVKGSGPVFLVPWNSDKNGDWVRVIVGVYDNKLDGERVLETLKAERWGKDVKLVENRWWQHTPGATGGDVFALADE